MGRDSRAGGHHPAGAKLVNVISNSRVPKLTVILGGSYGAGNYAMCGKAFDPRLIFAWPTAEYAVMGVAQAASHAAGRQYRRHEAAGNEPDVAELEELRRKVDDAYDACLDPRYAAARGWVDEIIEPADTRESADRGARNRHPPRRRRAIPHGRAAGVTTITLVQVDDPFRSWRRLRRLRGMRQRWPRPFSQVPSAAGNSCLPSL